MGNFVCCPLLLRSQRPRAVLPSPPPPPAASPQAGCAVTPAESAEEWSWREKFSPWGTATLLRAQGATHGKMREVGNKHEGKKKKVSLLRKNKQGVEFRPSLCSGLKFGAYQTYYHAIPPVLTCLPPPTSLGRGTCRQSGDWSRGGLPAGGPDPKLHTG